MIDDRSVSSHEVGRLRVSHLKRIWWATNASRNGRQVQRDGEWHLDRIVIDGLGLGLEQTLQYLFTDGPTFDQFEHWIVATAGSPEPALIARINAIVAGPDNPDEIRRWLGSIEDCEAVLSPADLAFWQEHGYIILHDAVEPSGLAAAVQAIWRYLDARPDDPETWYQERDRGIMLQFFQHSAFSANRRSRRIHKAFAQLWGTADLFVSTDRCGFNAPEREGWAFQGPDLHWDIDFEEPGRFGTQGILYLTDTPPDQGAFTLVPGFHKQINQWHDSLPAGQDPQQQDLHALGSLAIGGQAGDMVIWHQALPHGSRPNRSDQPRIVQYINMYPART